MKKALIIILCVFCFFAAVSCSKEEVKEEAKSEQYKPETLSQKYYYCFGNFMAKNYSSVYKDFDYMAVSEGLLSSMDGSFIYSDEEVNEIVRQYQALLDEQNNSKAADNLKKSEAFLAENKKKDGVKETASGLQYQVISEGTGAKPSEDSVVTVDYELSDIKGNIIESTLVSGRPASFSLKQVIPGFAEGLMLMNTGSTYKLFIHPNIGYGTASTGSIEPNQVLIFEVSLLSFN